MITEHFQLIEKFLEFVRSFESDPDFEDTLEGISVEDLSMDGIKYHVESALEAEELFDDDPEKVKLLEELSEMLDFIEGEDLYRSPDAQFEDLGFKKKIMRPIPTVFHTLVVFEKKTKNGMRHILFMKKPNNERLYNTTFTGDEKDDISRTLHQAIHAKVAELDRKNWDE